MATNITPWHDWPSNFTSHGVTNRSVEGIGSFFQYANESVGGYLGVMILFIVFIATFVIQGSNSEKRGTVSFFITAFIATLLMQIELIALPIVMSLWIGTAILIILVRNSTNAGRL